MESDYNLRTKSLSSETDSLHLRPQIISDYNLRTRSLSSDVFVRLYNPRLYLTITSVLEAFRQNRLDLAATAMEDLTITSVLEAFRQLKHIRTGM